ncbi:Queuine tRNA-ribosyltransferase-domain-containing protein [Crepidotus variabilis]|uniref:Queuine tRNA-ribosyltransferase-domain-containing protein n=1 Tax=Crepidotus variabilis TaxID=179855 RepID=A0A9P6EEX1_9AGAR|nr:Queuine tRNA-ribosyltransferase-domain-containing protein [Crepidotus variabilis]
MAMTASTSSVSFSLSNWGPVSTTRSKIFGPRLGSLILHRHPQESDLDLSLPSTSREIRLETPTFLTSTSRGVVPHLSRDNVKRCESIRWVNVPFESFMESNPPVPTIHPGPDPLHKFLGFNQSQQIISMSARNPCDGRQLPPNGKDTVSVWTLQGVRKLTPSDWQKYATKCQPDVVFALSDTPFTDPPYSQKRMTKSIERSAQWLARLLSSPTIPLPSVILHLAGLSSSPARRAFSNSLLEPLYGPELEAVAHMGIKNLDEGVVGYSVDLVPIRMTIEAEGRKIASTNNTATPSALTPMFNQTRHLAVPLHTAQIIPLVHSSLSSLPPFKLRLINGIESPHEVLRYISKVGIDVFDAGWAQKCASIGVALDFEFPVITRKDVGEVGRLQIGCNLYDEAYQMDFRALSSSFLCQCPTCVPVSTPEGEEIKHGVDSEEYTRTTAIPTHPSTAVLSEVKGYTRAYIHHLLHTHEMSAHTLLTMHNLETLDRFFRGIRGLLTQLENSQKNEVASSLWDDEVSRFTLTYDELASFEVLETARGMWKDVDIKRGKGRLSKEKNEGEND